jgi:carbohydrate kinase (thermoresistant glucokinase family)
MAIQEAECLVDSQAISVILIMGVTSSGKTAVGALLAGRLGWEFADADWFHPSANVEKMRAGTPLTDADREPWLRAIAEWINGICNKGGHAVVACSVLKRRYRDQLIKERTDARLVYLRGDEALIAQRMAARHGHFMPQSLLHSQFEALEEPGPDEHPLAVSIKPTPSEIVTEIVTKLGVATT